MKTCSKCGQIEKHYKSCRWCVKCLKAYNKERYEVNTIPNRKTEKELLEYAKRYNSSIENDDVTLLLTGLQRIGEL